MKEETKKPDWKELKGQIKNKFSKLSDSDVEGLKGNMDQLPKKVQKVYNYDQAKAEKECKAFNESIKR